MPRFEVRAPYSGLRTLAATLLLSAMLSACGGGGSSTPAPADLQISEVATNYYRDGVAWFELYNPTAEAIALSGYTLRSGSIVPDTGKRETAPVSFDLPAASVPAKGYLVVAAGVYDQLADNPQMVYVRKDEMVPFWNGSGSVELLKNDKTVDFVRFGDSTATPETASHWNGASVPALPSAADEHGKSIVRLAAKGMADTNSAADWTLVNFSTPAGPNDIAADVVDSDHDGIPDSAKIAGNTYGGLDLYAMGARPGRRDLFIEIDHMDGPDPALTPRREALEKMVAAFDRQGIALHLDTGPLYGASFDPQNFNLGGGNAVPFAKCTELFQSSVDRTDDCLSLYTYKSANFDVRRKLVFHYALFASSRNADGSAGSSGVAKIFGNDLIISLGNYGFDPTTPAGLNRLISVQAGTLMHEFGHNLGLQHGGNEEVNYKPNYYSVMNYLYQFPGLSRTPNTINAAERYYMERGWKGLTTPCSLVENSPCGDDFYMDYSDGSSAPLDESQLSELVNIGRGRVDGAYADWDNNGALTPGLLAIDLNGDGKKTVLTDYNDWANLKLPFARTFYGSTSGRPLARQTPQFDPMSERAQIVSEAPLPEALRAELLKAAAH